MMVLVLHGRVLVQRLRGKRVRAFGLGPTCRLILCSFFGFLDLGRGIYNHKVEYPKNGYGTSLQLGFLVQE